MAQSKEDLEEFYKEPDPWGYRTYYDDIVRRKHIVNLANVYAPDATNTLDIGCGEGWVTEKLPGVLFGIETSDNAVKRWPRSIERLYRPQGGFDLVVATGVLYDDYDWKKMREWIEESAIDIVITCHYDQMGIAHDVFKKKKLFFGQFPYRDGYQTMKVYQW